MATFEVSSIQMHETVSGDTLSAPIFTYKGKNPGPKVYIQASMHGAELQGNAVIYELMKWLENNEINGELILAPTINPYGLSHKHGEYTFGRFDPVTGDNWNRSYFDIWAAHKEDIKAFALEHKDDHYMIPKFREFLGQKINEEEKKRKIYGTSAGKRMCLEAQKLSYDADYVLDLHTAPNAVRYIYSAHYGTSDAKLFRFPHVLSFDEEFAGALDEASFNPWCKLRDELKELGVDFSVPVRAYTIELGGQETISTSEAKEDLNCLLNFLTAKGSLSSDLTYQDREVFVCDLNNDYRVYKAPSGGLAEYLVTPGQDVNEGDPLYSLLNFKQINSPSDLNQAKQIIRAQKPGKVIFVASSSAVTFGMDTVQIMENPKPL